ncbi:16S rRNA (guanine(966)-N(2))-methyltransferase RsmD [Brevinema andersonii]|uniref:16S rRNA (Guanine(966)-N(2))-methyltransferase RsmD n=1 Tax=Brevinema andersonii TaxID=34097 RepID=A0A1I1D3H8_BREAD|nr:RsmD family RNA methyltransferase [Brevinema andersonii]SFB69337.1 16S rRNA (guanine(966)-N(2))-methyltransferase RsmD [Brevinema andersonii]
MKVTSGKWKGRTILAPEWKLKPTSDKVRQALFNMLRPISGIRFLDLFAGSGIVGITALSEGASFAAFVERDNTMFNTLRQNLKNVGCSVQEGIALRGNALKAGSLFSGERFDVIFADPFYADTPDILEILYDQAKSLLAENGVFVLEHGSNIPEDCLSKLSGLDSVKHYGDTMLSVYRRMK